MSSLQNCPISVNVGRIRGQDGQRRQKLAEVVQELANIVQDHLVSAPNWPTSRQTDPSWGQVFADEPHVMVPTTWARALVDVIPEEVDPCGRQEETRRPDSR